MNILFNRGIHKHYFQFSFGVGFQVVDFLFDLNFSKATFTHMLQHDMHAHEIHQKLLKDHTFIHFKHKP